MKTALRFAFFLVNTGLVLLAVLTVGGRLLMLFAGDLEQPINGFLVRYGAAVEGLEGGWHGLNPVVRARRVHFPGGEAESIRFELDLLETLLHGTVVARHVAAARLTIAPVRTLDRRWTLGAPASSAGTGFDPLPFLENSDRLELPDVRLRFLAEASDNFEDPLELLADLTLSARIDNSFRRQVGHVRLAQTDDPCAACALEASWHLRGLLPRVDQRGAIVVSGDGFRLPASLGRALGAGGATFERLSGKWTVRDGRGSGAIDLALKDVVLPAGALDAIELEARGVSPRWSLEMRWAVQRLVVRTPGGSETSIEGLLASLRESITGSVIEWSVPELDVATQVPIVHAAFSEMRWADEWLPALEPRGRVAGLSGRFDLRSKRLALAAHVEQVALEHHKGAPYVRNGRADVVGSERGFVIRIDADDIALGLLDVYDVPTTFEHLAGDVHLWFKGRFLQVRGDALVGRLGPSTLRGAFAVSRPQDPLAQRIALWMSADVMDAATAKAFVPVKLPPAMRQWIDHAVLSGTARNAAIAFHGDLRSQGDLPVRQTALAFDVSDGAVRFHEDWPIADALEGAVVIAADGVRARLDRGNLSGVAIGGGFVEAQKGAHAVHLTGSGRADGAALLRLVGDSPLAEPLAFIRPEWRLAGPLDYSVDLTVPTGRLIAEEQTPPDVEPPRLAVALTAELRGVTADLGNIGLVISGLSGSVAYRYPDELSAARVDGELFGERARFTAASDDGRIRLAFAGRAPVVALADWLGVPAVSVADGAVDFDGELDAWPGQERGVSIAVRSDLVGARIDLPEPFGKAAESPRGLALEIDPAEDVVLVRAGLADTGHGWLRIPASGGPRGTFALGDEVPVVDASQDALVLTGTVAETDLGGWLGLVPKAREAATGPPLAIEGLRVGALRARDLVLADLTIDASRRDGVTTIGVSGEAIEGEFEMPTEGPSRLWIRHLRLPATETDEEKDPLAGFDMSVVDAVDVTIDEAGVGDESYGNWRFGLRRDGDVIRLEDVVGELRGLRVEGSAPILWQWREPTSTHLAGRVAAGDLGQVLTAFGYARSVETKKASAAVDLKWPGSPLNFSLPALVGTVDARAEEGRFLEVDSGSGPLRVFSLLNFTAIAKRMALDFSDVFGKGVSFEELTARLGIDRSRLDFLEPMVIDGTGGYFRVSGNVDLESGALDNEMIVTLPVNKSLPWYAAYLSFVNPIAAGAVLVGERIFRNQIQQFSSATYRVSGTLEDPKVEFVGIFGRPAGQGETPASVQPAPAPLESKPETGPEPGADPVEPT